MREFVQLAKPSDVCRSAVQVESLTIRSHVGGSSHDCAESDGRRDRAVRGHQRCGRNVSSSSAKKEANLQISRKCRTYAVKVLSFLVQSYRLLRCQDLRGSCSDVLELQICYTGMYQSHQVAGALPKAWRQGKTMQSRGLSQTSPGNARWYV